jgi:putative transposase
MRFSAGLEKSEVFKPLRYALLVLPVRRSMSTYSVTAVTFQRRALFLRNANAELLVTTIFRYREQGRFLLHGFAVMPEHLHVLLTPANGQTVERCVPCIKGGFSFAMREQFAGEIWQVGFHEHRIRDSKDFRNQLDYVAQNPQRGRLTDYRFVHTNYVERFDGISCQKQNLNKSAKSIFSHPPGPRVSVSPRGVAARYSPAAISSSHAKA